MDNQKMAAACLNQMKPEEALHFCFSFLYEKFGREEGALDLIIAIKKWRDRYPDLSNYFWQGFVAHMSRKRAQSVIPYALSYISHYDLHILGKSMMKREGDIESLYSLFEGAAEKNIPDFEYLIEKAKKNRPKRKAKKRII